MSLNPIKVLTSFVRLIGNTLSIGSHVKYVIPNRSLTTRAHLDIIIGIMVLCGWDG